MYPESKKQGNQSDIVSNIGLRFSSDIGSRSEFMYSMPEATESPPPHPPRPVHPGGGTEGEGRQQVWRHIHFFFGGGGGWWREGRGRSNPYTEVGNLTSKHYCCSYVLSAITVKSDNNDFHNPWAITITRENFSPRC
jgi:hypothetical protein